MIYNFIGQPHSGKTTLARHLRTALQIRNESRLIYMIDGDKLRDLFQNKDYSEIGRRKNIDRAYSIARYIQDLNPFNDVIIAVVSPFLDLREELKCLFSMQVKTARRQHACCARLGCTKTSLLPSPNKPRPRNVECPITKTCSLGQ